MGRYYVGMISGKFWFGVQSSNDAENFGGSECVKYEYKCCGCFVDDTTIPNNYCDMCFKSFKHHYKTLIEDKPDSWDSDNDSESESEKDYEDIEIDKDVELFGESNYVQMNFEAEQLEEVQKHIAEYEKIVLPYIKLFIMDKENNYNCNLTLVDEYENEYNKLSEDILTLIARWCLAKQVEACLIDNDYCSFDCEC